MELQEGGRDGVAGRGLGWSSRKETGMELQEWDRDGGRHEVAGRRQGWSSRNEAGWSSRAKTRVE